MKRVSDFKVGDRVEIYTAYHGMYHGKFGTVIENPAKMAFQDDSFIRVRFDSPISYGDREVENDVFQARDLNRKVET